jgi:hypothetical protein
MTIVTWNSADKDAGVTLSNGDLTATATGSYHAVRANVSRSTGKWYFEGQLVTAGYGGFGVNSASESLSTYIGNTTNGRGMLSTASGGMYREWFGGTRIGAGNNLPVAAAGDTLMVAVDFTNSKIWFGCNGIWFGAAQGEIGDPAAGTNAAFTNLPAVALFPAWCSATTTTAINARFDEMSCLYPAPSGFSYWDDTATGYVGANRLAGLGSPSWTSITTAKDVVTGNSPTIKLQGLSTTVARTGPTSNSLNYVPLGKSMTISRGTITRQTQVDNTYSMASSGLSVTVSQGVVSAGVGFAGQSATTQQGALTATVTTSLVGQQVICSGRSIAAVQSGADVAVLVANYDTQLSMSVGVVGQVLGTGASYSTRKSVVTTSVTNTSPANFSGSPSISAFTFGNNFAPFDGLLKGGGEFVVNGANVSPETESAFYYHIDRTAQSFPTQPFFTSLTFNNPGGVASTYDSQPYDFAPPTSYGGKTSVGRDGVTWGVYTRAYGRIGGDTTTPDVLHITTREHINGEGWYGGYIQRLNVPTLDEADTLGCYAHDANNFYIFYPATNGGDKVPAYRRYTGTGGTNSTLATFNSEVKLSSFTGNGSVTARAGSMCVTRSGYGDTIYITYESGTGHIGLIVMDAVTETVTSHTLTSVVTPATTFVRTDERHLAKIPTSAISEVAVLSNGTSVSQFLISAAEVFGGAWNSGGGGGGAVTSTKPRVVHLSWTSATATAPTMTLKAGPSDSSLAGGLESLEVRGDEVVHVLYRYSSSFQSGPDRYVFSYTTQSNDATGTGNSWTLDSSTTWQQTVTYDINVATTVPSLHYSGFGGGLGAPSVLALVPYGRYNYYTQAKQAWATLNYWGEANQLFSFLTYGGVGRVTVTAISFDSLLGRTATISQGVLTPSISASIGSGLVATVSGGTVIGAETHDITYELAGVSAAVTQGALVVVRGAALAGQSIASTSGILTPVTSVFALLTGLQSQVSGGAAVPVMALTLGGSQLTAQHGLLGIEVALGLTSQSLTASSGVFVPALTLRLIGAQLQSGVSALIPLSLLSLTGISVSVLSASLQPALTTTMLGQVATITDGQLAFLYDCNLFPVGLQALAELGVYPITTNVPAIRADHRLWVQLETEILFATELPGDLHVDIEPGQ